MIDERLGSPNELAGALAAHLEGPDLPEPRDLRSLIEIAFFASLNEEEGQRLAFTIAWIGHAGADRAMIVTRVAARALDHGHGGMILIIPAATREPEGVRAHYGVGAGSDVLARRYAELVACVPPHERLARIAGSRPRAADGRVHVRDEAQLRAADAVDFVARLTAIDNALLLDLCAARARGRAHQRDWRAQRAEPDLRRGLGCVHDLCRGAAAPCDVMPPLRADDRES